MFNLQKSHSSNLCTLSDLDKKPYGLKGSEIEIEVQFFLIVVHIHIYSFENYNKILSLLV